MSVDISRLGGLIGLSLALAACETGVDPDVSLPAMYEGELRLLETTRDTELPLYCIFHATFELESPGPSPEVTGVWRVDAALHRRDFFVCNRYYPAAGTLNGVWAEPDTLLMVVRRDSVDPMDDALYQDVAGPPWKVYLAEDTMTFEGLTDGSAYRLVFEGARR